MKLKYAILSLVGLTVSSQAATTLTNQVLVNFDGSIVGNTYTLGAGETDTTGTFGGFGNPAVAAGESDLTPNQGFDFNPGSLGALTSQNWIAEVIVTLDANTNLTTLIDVQGDTDFRINGGNIEAAYWDGSTGGSATVGVPATGTTMQLALVWDAAATSLTGYIDGVSIGTVDNGAFATPDTSNVSFGYFGRAGFDDRGADGQIDAVAFSTFTGSFDAGTDLQLNAVPEPSSLALLGLGGVAMILRRRK